MAKTPAKKSTKKAPAKGKGAAKKATGPKRDLYQEITDKIIAGLETGVRPWTKPWSVVGGSDFGPIVRPRRVGGQPYRGINVMLLWGAMAERGFTNPTWMTYNQAQELGGQVRKGEKSEMIVYANKFVKTDKDEGTGEEKSRMIFFLKPFFVFNVEQIDNLPERFYPPADAPEAPPEQVEQNRIERVQHAEEFFAAQGAQLRHGGNSAFYSPAGDHIQMPEFERFESAEAYYATLGHEFVHWTRHETRLNRSFGRRSWGDEGYAQEELVAELGAAFLCADLGLALEPREDHVAYIENWLRVLKNDKKFIVTAASFAQKAVDFLHVAGLAEAAGEPEAGEDEADHMDVAA